MSTDVALPTSLADIEAQLTSLSGNPARYIAARLRDPEADKVAILRSLGLAWHTLSRWRCDPGKAALKQLDDAIEHNAPMLQAATATAILLNGAPTAAVNLLDMAEKPAATDRQLQVRLQANVKVLEAVGVLQSGSKVTVNVDNRRVDSAAITAWKERRAAVSAPEPTQSLNPGSSSEDAISETGSQ